MKIQSYEVLTGSSRTSQKFEYERTGVSMWTGGDKKQSQDSLLVSGRWDSVSFSAEQTSQQTYTQLSDGALPEEAVGDAPREIAASPAKPGWTGVPLTDRQRMKLELLRDMIFALTGRRLEFSFLDMGKTGTAGRARVSARGVQMVHEKATMERESVQYNARGVVHTADGKTIKVDVMMNMSREFAEYSRTQLGVQFPQGSASAVDPLVINYGGTAASLTGEKFSFDLDCDGRQDSISFAGPGSGFLALDKNGDGVINDGSELFGPASGNGFGELRGYDRDGNGWIDENDDVFSQLVVWSKDADGKDQLFTLKELGIGAIYLGETATRFDMKSGGQTQGQMQSTSFFLRENGSAGFVHHIDLVV